MIYNLANLPYIIWSFSTLPAMFWDVEGPWITWEGTTSCVSMCSSCNSLLGLCKPFIKKRQLVSLNLPKIMNFRCWSVNDKPFQETNWFFQTHLTLPIHMSFPQHLLVSVDWFESPRAPPHEVRRQGAATKTRRNKGSTARNHEHRRGNTTRQTGSWKKKDVSIKKGGQDVFFFNKHFKFQNARTNMLLASNSQNAERHIAFLLITRGLVRQEGSHAPRKLAIKGTNVKRSGPCGFGKCIHATLGILAHLLRTVMEPKYLSFRRWLYTPIIIWQGGWIPRANYFTRSRNVPMF